MNDIKGDPTRGDQYKDFNFILCIDDEPVAGFSKMSRLQHPEITLERGLTHDEPFQNWVSEVSDSSSGTRKDLKIDVFDAAGKMVIRYRLLRCRVVAIQMIPDLDAPTNAIAIATLALESEGEECQQDRRAASEEPS